MNRETALQQILDRRAPWDIAVIGGGATGVGVAVDAASRGYDVVLLEQSDFGKGTSSRSTKLVHGGVRYLQQGNVSLVRQALIERGRLLQNAPHLVRDLPFVVPNYLWWEKPFYGFGLKLYDRLAGKYGFGRSIPLTRAEVLRRLPTVQTEGLRGGVLYHDGQFDDSRLLINLAQTAEEHGAHLINYAPVIGLVKNAQGRVAGCQFRDEESGREHSLAARCVINATGPFGDGLRRLEDPQAAPLLAPSQGSHLILDRSFLPSESALMVPHTRDGRVMFAIPWEEHTLVGTTDTPMDSVPLEPRPLAEEIEFILETARHYLVPPPQRGDVRSVFSGIRPLVKAGHGSRTASLSRDHSILASASGLLTILGGKWTTYRKMAEDGVDHAIELAKLEPRPCVTQDLPIHGHTRDDASTGPWAGYGADAASLEELCRRQTGLGQPLSPALPLCGAHVVWAVRHEMARTVEDVLARRSRALFLDSRTALALAPAVAQWMATELGQSEAWQRQQVATFAEVAKGFVVEETENSNAGGTGKT